MAMNRRQWLQRVSAGVVGACLATKIPTGWLPETMQSHAACEFLRRHVNDWFSRYGIDCPPRVIVADASLYAAYVRELKLLMRFTAGAAFSERERGCLLFKGIPIRESAIASGDGWRVMLVAGETEAA